jgi:predicted DNA-binding transcriptional regulator AlpA
MNRLNSKIFVRPFEIQEIYGISRSTAYRLMQKNNEFPKLVCLTERCRAWQKKELDIYFNISA